MRSRIISLRSSLLSVSKLRKYGSKPHRCDAHMNELPVPCGPWDPWYKDKQTFYTQVLVGGVLWWVFSLGFLIYTEAIFFNWGPPDMPGPPSDFVEECEEVA